MTELREKENEAQIHTSIHGHQTPRSGIATPLKWPSKHGAASTFRRRAHYGHDEDDEFAYFTVR